MLILIDCVDKVETNAFCYTPAPPEVGGGAGILFYLLSPSVLPSVLRFFRRIFSATIVGRNLIFGHKLHYRIKRFFSGVHACVNGADAITK